MHYSFRAVQDAVSVLTGKWENIDDVDLVYNKTPEDCLIEEDSIRGLSADAQKFIDTIRDNADKFLKVDGTLKAIKFQAFLKESFGWNPHKVDLVKKEIKKFLKKTN